MASSRLEAFEHQVDHGDVNPGFAAVGALFAVFAQSATSAQPGQSSFYHPPSGQYLKVAAVGFAFHHGEQPSAHRPSPVHQLTRVASVSPDQLQPGEITQQLGQHQLGAIPVPVSWHGAGSGCWRHAPPPPKASPWCPPRCGVCVRLPSCQRRNLWAPFFRGLHRLAVNYSRIRDGSAGGGFPSGGFPNPDPQCFLNPLPSPVFPPLAETPPHRAPEGQVVGHHPPDYAASQHVQDAVDYLPQVRGSGRASLGVRRQQGSQFLPLGIGQIAGIRFSAHASSVTAIPFSSQEQPAHLFAIATHPLRASVRESDKSDRVGRTLYSKPMGFGTPKSTVMRTFRWEVSL